MVTAKSVLIASQNRREEFGAHMDEGQRGGDKRSG